RHIQLRLGISRIGCMISYSRGRSTIHRDLTVDEFFHPVQISEDEHRSKNLQKVRLTNIPTSSGLLVYTKRLIQKPDKRTNPTVEKRQPIKTIPDIAQGVLSAYADLI